MMCDVSDLVPYAKAVDELEPAVQAFADATGALGPVRELAAWATDLVRYRRAPYQAKLLMRAAEKVRASGLPPSAVEDKLLRAALEDGALEEDEEMQERWANLLANASTRPARVRAAFPKILAELDPTEARFLDGLARTRTDENYGQAVEYEPLPSWVPAGGRDNLLRLNLLRELRQEETGTAESPVMVRGPVVGYVFTALGWELVKVCRPPESVQP